MSISRWFAFAMLTTAALPRQGGAVTLMVNEYRNAAGAQTLGTKMASDEYIEFVVGEAATAEQLAALTFGDMNDGTSMIRSVFQFDLATLQQVLTDAGRTEFLPGTVIVVKGAGLGAQELGYQPDEGNTGNSDAWSIQLVAGQGAKDHSETLINGTLSVGNGGEMIWVSSSAPPANNTDISGFESVLGHGNNQGVLGTALTNQFGAGVVWNGTITSGQSLSNVGTAGAPVLAVSTTGTMGAANSAANQNWLSNIRTASFIVTAPEPSRGLLLLVSSVGTWWMRTRRRPSHAV
ncbi:MAG: hypothetical protein JNJ83_07130 [Verrucomicrobiaceae bacterium]|nr:hypothetical protein [Verrucomicrobiaceae bacterium]